MSELVVTNLLVYAEDKTILDIDRLKLEENRLHALVGPSGAGKSTLLRVINLLQKPASGNLHFGDIQADLPSLSQAKGVSLQRKMAFVAQKPVMFQMSVFQNVALGLKYRGLDQKTIKTRVDHALELVQLSQFAGQQATSLSGGEAQRIALARAIVCQPSLLLLDEPTANLDPYNVSIFEQVIKNIQLQQKPVTTILMVTHNLPQARRLAYTCLFLHKGKVMETDATEDFFTSPCTQELQDFLSGRMIY